MKTKICTKCNKTLPATNEFFYIGKRGKYGLVAICKSCQIEYRKQYTSTDTYKKRRREEMAKWRKENPEKNKELRDRSYKKNKERVNKERREKYNTDEEYRQRQNLYDKKYTESGRRKELYAKNYVKERLRVKNWRNNNQEQVKKYQKVYREQNRAKTNKIAADNRKNLHITYIAQCMRIKASDLTPEVCKTKQIIIKLKRELRNNNVKIR